MPNRTFQIYVAEGRSMLQAICTTFTFTCQYPNTLTFAYIPEERCAVSNFADVELFF
jgi:hypothetical protein